MPGRQTRWCRRGCLGLLSEEQAAKIEAILRDAAAKREALEKDGQADSREGFSQRRQVRRQIDAVLTPEQREKRDKVAAEHKQKRGWSTPFLTL